MNIINWKSNASAVVKALSDKANAAATPEQRAILDKAEKIQNELNEVTGRQRKLATEYKEVTESAQFKEASEALGAASRDAGHAKIAARYVAFIMALDNAIRSLNPSASIQTIWTMPEPVVRATVAQFVALSPEVATGYAQCFADGKAPSRLKAKSYEAFHAGVQSALNLFSSPNVK